MDATKIVEEKTPILQQQIDEIKEKRRKEAAIIKVANSPIRLITSILLTAVILTGFGSIITGGICCGILDQNQNISILAEVILFGFGCIISGAGCFSQAGLFIEWIGAISRASRKQENSV